MSTPLLLAPDLSCSLDSAGDRAFLGEMAVLVPWQRLAGLVGVHTAHRRGWCQPHSTETLLRIYFVQRWFACSDADMADVLFCAPLVRTFVGLGTACHLLPDARALRHFRCLLDRSALAVELLHAVQQLMPGDARVRWARSASDAALMAWFARQEMQA